jgi:hypothetical protein
MTNHTNPAPQDEDLISQKRNILMDMLYGILNSPRKESSAELWKLYIDAALDRLDAAHDRALKERLLAEGPKDHNCNDEVHPASLQWTREHKISVDSWNQNNDQWRSAIGRVFGGKDD